MAINPPGAIQIPPAVDQRLWDFLLSRPSVAVPIAATGANKLLQGGTGILLGWSLRETTGTAPAQVEFIDGQDVNGIVVAEAVIPPPGTSVAGTVDVDVDASTAVANANNFPVLPAAAGATTFVTGFEVTGSGATAGSVVLATLVNTLGGNKVYNIVVPAGVTNSITPLIVEFSRPIPAFALNTAIQLQVSPFGAGNTNEAATIHGFQRTLGTAGVAAGQGAPQNLPGNGLFLRNGLFMRVVQGSVVGAAWVKL